MASLLALSRAGSERAKRRFNQRYLVHGLSLAFGLAALFLPTRVQQILAVLALLSEGVAWVVRHEASSLHGLSEQGRRAALLGWAFGADRETLDAVDLRALLPADLETLAPAYEDPNYYSSSLPPGPGRFADAIQESAFWSKHLCRLAGRCAVGAVVVLGVAIVAMFIVLAQLSSSGVLQTVAQVLVPVLTFFLAADFLGQGLAWLEAERTADRVDRTLERRGELKEADLLALFSDYSTALAAAPPIPTWLYKREKARLERGWARRRASIGATGDLGTLH